ncbi:MAG: arabinosyltransferase domain-containing protein [Acidimicrobiia bacterium]
MREDREVRQLNTARTRFLSVGWLRSADHMVVYGSLTLLWIVGPVYLDDGWLLAAVENYQPDGAYATYYANFNLVNPFWVPHLTLLRIISWVSVDLVWLRLPAVLAGVGVWHLTRSIVVRIAARVGRAPTLGLHMMTAGGFLLGWMSWNVTLRPEPSVAFLGAVALWAAVRFGQKPHGRYLLLGAIAVVFAVSVHPAGLVVLAPAIPLTLAVVRWLRISLLQRSLMLLAILLVSAALLLLLVWGPLGREWFGLAVDGTAAQASHAQGWRHEPSRYMELVNYGNSARRLTVTLPLVGVIMFLGQRRRGRDVVADLPILSLMIGALLLMWTPSKWMWHLGSLMPYAAAAIAVEWWRWRGVRRSDRSLESASAAIIGVVGLTVIAWTGGFGWHTSLALGHLDFSQGILNALVVVLANPLLWLGSLVAAWLATELFAHLRLRRARARLWHERAAAEFTPWLHGAAAGLLSISLSLAVVVPLSVLTADGLMSPGGWSLAKQNLRAAFTSTCGLSEEIVVESGVRGLPLATESLLDHGIGDSLVSEHTSLAFESDGVYLRSRGAQLDLDLMTWGSWIDGDGDTGWFASPWFSLHGLTSVDPQDVLISTAGAPTLGGNMLFVQGASRRGTEISYGPLVPLDLPQYEPSWLVSEVEGSWLGEHVSFIRLIAIDGSVDPGGWLAFSAPYVLTYESLDVFARERGGSTLIAQQLRMYFPCLRQPAIAGGVAEVPDLILVHHQWPFFLYGSPHYPLVDFAEVREIAHRWPARGTVTPINVLTVTIHGSE